MPWRVFFVASIMCTVMKVLVILSLSRGIEERRRRLNGYKARRGLELKEGSKPWPTTIVDTPARNGSKATLIVVVSGRPNAHPSDSALQALEFGVVRRASEQRFLSVLFKGPPRACYPTSLSPYSNRTLGNSGVFLYLHQYRKKLACEWLWHDKGGLHRILCGADSFHAANSMATQRLQVTLHMQPIVSNDMRRRMRCQVHQELSVQFELEAVNALAHGVNVSACIEPKYGFLNEELTREWIAYHRYIAGIQRIYLVQQAHFDYFWLPEASVAQDWAIYGPFPDFAILLDPSYVSEFTLNRGKGVSTRTQSIEICVHEHWQDKWILIAPSFDEFLTSPLTSSIRTDNDARPQPQLMEIDQAYNKNTYNTSELMSKQAEYYASTRLTAALDTYPPLSKVRTYKLLHLQKNASSTPDESSIRDFDLQHGKAAGVCLQRIEFDQSSHGNLTGNCSGDICSIYKPRSRLYTDFYNIGTRLSGNPKCFADPQRVLDANIHIPHFDICHSSYLKCPALMYTKCHSTCRGAAAPVSLPYRQIGALHFHHYRVRPADQLESIDSAGNRTNCALARHSLQLSSIVSALYNGKTSTTAEKNSLALKVESYATCAHATDDDLLRYYERGFQK